MMRYLGKVVLLAGAYFVAGSLGQSLAIPPGNVTLVWPPSGIALAALLLGGDRLWPAIWLGALLVNVRTLFDPALSPSLAASLTAAAAIATGSTVQALVGRRWIAHLAGGPSFLDQARGVFRFTAGAMLMCLIGSTVGATSLAMAGFIPRDAHGFVWRTWWLGDLAGVLAFTPPLVAWTRRPPARWAPGRLAEAAAFVGLLAATTVVVFGGWLPAGASAAYLTFPILMWAAFRFGQRGATAALGFVAAMASWGTGTGAGPFQGGTLQMSLLLLQLFVSVLTLSTLCLAAVVEERRRAAGALDELNRTLEQQVAERSAAAEQRAGRLARSEAACREQARTFRSVLDNILEGIVVADAWGEIVLWNPAAERLIGSGPLDVGPDQWSSRYGCFLPDRVTPYPVNRLPLMRVLRGEVVRGEEMFLRNPYRPDGIWLRITGVPLRHGGGEAVGGVVVLRDDTDRKQAEIRMQSVIESVLTGIVVVNEGGRITQVNRQTELLFGYAREELCGQSVEVLMPEHLRQTHRRHFEDYLGDPQARAMGAMQNIRGRRKDGRTIDLQVALSPFRQDGELFILASVLDITEQKRASDLVQSVVEFSPDGTIMVDRAGRIVLVNQETERMFGYAREELLGQPLGILVPERSRDRHQGLCSRFIGERRQRSMNQGADLYGLRRDGSEFPVDIALHSYELNGESFAVASARDMTERRRLMEAVETNLQVQGAISQVLRNSLEPIGVEEQLHRALDVILSIPWFASPARGEIFLVGGDDGTLVLKAQRGLFSGARSRCDPIPSGHCPCGRTARHGEVVFAGGPDGRVGPGDPGQSPQAHYCVPILDGEHYGIINVFVDEPHPRSSEEEAFLSSVARILAGTIERRRAEEELRASEGRFRQLAETMPQIVWTSGADGTFTYFNDRWYQYTGLAPEDSLVRDGVPMATHPDGRDRFAGLRAQAVDAGEAFESEVRLRHRSGAYRWHLVRSVPVRDEAGRVVRRFGTATDIDDHRRTEEALRASERQFRAVFNQQFQFMALVATDGMVLEANDTCFRATGVPRESVLGRLLWETPWWDRLPDMQQRWKQYVAEALRTDGAATGEVDYSMADGTVRRATIAVTGIKDEAGRVDSLIVEGRDETDRIEADVALRESEARFRAISEAAPLGIFLTDAAGDCLYTNRAYLELAGRGAEEALGKGWREIIHPEDRESVSAEWYRAARDRLPFDLTYRFLHRDGRTIWVSTRSAEIRVGDALAGYVGVVEDITQKRQAIEALRRSEERFDLAVRGTDAGIWDWDLRTDTIYFSPRWKSMLGYAEGEIGDGCSEWESRLHPEDRERAGKAVQDYLEGRSAEYELEHRLRHKDGSYRWILARGAAVRDDDGRPYRMVGSHIDVTVHKQTVDQLNENLVQLRAAQRIQQAMLPKQSPDLTGLDIAGISYPAAYAGGDMFDYLPMLGGNLGIVVGDVAGHGIGAALQMASTLAFLRSLAQTCATVGEVMARVNRFVFEETLGDSFVTLMLIRLDPRTRSLTYANAGHPPGYVLDPSGEVRAELGSSALPLGLEEHHDFPVAEPVVLRPGELVVLVTDGILEPRSPEGAFFGKERLLDVVRAARDRASHEIVEELHRAVGRHTGTAVCEDDVTAVVIKVGRGGP